MKITMRWNKDNNEIKTYIEMIFYMLKSNQPRTIDIPNTKKNNYSYT